VVVSIDQILPHRGLGSAGNTNQED